MAKPPARPKATVAQEIDDEESYIASEIAKRIESIVPKGQQAQVVAQVVSVFQQEAFSGPIAHPRHLAEYERIQPGAADRIIKMAEADIKHRQDLQSRIMDAEIKDTRDGRIYGFITLLLLFIGAVVSLYMNNTVAVGIFLGAGALGVIGKFVDGRG